MERRILHVDFNCFYASVACCMQPELKPYPVAVAGNPEARHGIILAKNEPAKKFGVRTGEAIWQAKAKCPRLVLVPPDFPAYQEFSRCGREIYAQYSDLVEGFGLDENWIDVSGTTYDFSQATQLAEEIRCRVSRELGITVSVGVASNKVFSKLGSDIKKPDAVTVVSPQNYRQIAWPLPVRDLLYVGSATEGKLRRYGIETIGDLAETPATFLKAQLGKCGLMLHEFANGRDAAPVLPMMAETIPKSIGNGITTPRDLADNADVWLTVFLLSESVAARLRAQRMRAGTIQIAVRDKGLYSFSRQTRFGKPTHITNEIAHAAMELFLKSYNWQAPIRSLTVTATDLIDENSATQLSLLDDEVLRLRNESLDSAVDRIRSRFGQAASYR